MLIKRVKHIVDAMLKPSPACHAYPRGLSSLAGSCTYAPYCVCLSRPYGSPFLLQTLLFLQRISHLAALPRDLASDILQFVVPNSRNSTLHRTAPHRTGSIFKRKVPVG